MVLDASKTKPRINYIKKALLSAFDKRRPRLIVYTLNYLSTTYFAVKDVVKSVRRISSAHNKGEPANINTLLFLIERRVCIHLQEIANLKSAY